MRRAGESEFGAVGLAVLLGLTGCGSGGAAGAGTGGQSGADASVGGTGGASSGKSGGGAANVGGARSTGGAAGTGGAGGSGGAPNTGGAGTGGAVLSGGNSGTGGARQGGSGGSTDSGGMGGGGGSPSGGAGGSGGSTSSGGAGGSGGSTGSGGAGTGGTGGTENTGGASVDSGGTGTIGAGGAIGSRPDAGTDGGDERDGGRSVADGGSPDASVGDTVILNVDLTGSVRPISPLIYGVNQGTLVCTNPSARFTLCRQGGKPSSTYNWENNASNAGDDRCFENDDALGVSNSPGQTVTSLVDAAGTRASLVTIPIGDYVAADKNAGSGPPACSGDVRNSGATYLTTRFKANHALKGTALSALPDTTDGSVYQDEFVNFVKGHAPTAQVLFAMDNQPELWAYSHPEVHPNPATYAEVVARNVEYASMVRERWPEAGITGAVGYGFKAFISLQDAPDSAGKPDFTSYYLAAMKKAGDDAGKRLIDYLDVHWYSEANSGGVRVLAPDATPPDPGIVTARVQAPRSLWDSSYNEGSFINADLGGPIELLHWFDQRIVANYPGTKLAFTAWSHGGEEHVSGAIAAADTLGIFGREGVALAAIDPSVTNTNFLVGAFAAYRNYDGAGASFGDTSVGATTSDTARVTIYASTDSTTPGRVVLIVINRAASPVPTTLTIQHATNFSTASVYQITGFSALPTPAAGLIALPANVFSFEPPAYSVSVIVPQP